MSFSVATAGSWAAPSDHSSSANSRFTRSRYEQHGASEGSHGAGERQRATARNTTALTEASDLIRRLTGISELDYETAEAAKRNGRPLHAVTVDDLRTIDQHAHDAAGRGADYISMHRLSELIGATTLDAYADLGNLIATQQPARYAPSIYRTTAESGST